MPTTINGTSGDNYLTAPDGGVYVLNGLGGNDHLLGGSGTNHMSGGLGNDTLQAGSGVNFMLGDTSPSNPAAGGKDTFIVSLNALKAGAAVTVFDFGGAGGYAASDNDFMAFTGFSAGSWISSVTDSKVDSHLAYYTLHDNLSGLEFTVAIRSTNGHHLGAGDFNFYH